jgi:hypothetical protein
MRRVLFALLLAGCAGTFVELLLLDHDEDAWQLIPLLLLAGGGALLVWTAVRPGLRTLWAFRIVMMLFVAGSGLGLALHYQANLEFQRDLDPAATTTQVFWKVLAAKTPPALAPAVLGQLGCLGLIYSYRLPVGRHTAVEGDDDVAIR